MSTGKAYNKQTKIIRIWYKRVRWILDFENKMNFAKTLLFKIIYEIIYHTEKIIDLISRKQICN